MDDLITFLRACLDDDERVAREALHDDAVRPGQWTTEHHGMGREPNTCHIAEDRSGHYWSVAHDVFIPNAAHIARWDPARVLADIDAKRRIIDEHSLESNGACRVCTLGWSARPAAYPCPTVRLLALPYADREGYREEWRP